jgi:hypothetical protein
MELLGDVGYVKLVLIHSKMVLALVQGRCKACGKRTIGFEVILDTPDATPR